MTDAVLRQAIIEQYCALVCDGLTAGTAGNISVRTLDGMLITPTGAAAADLAPDRLVAMALDGTVNGDIRPSSEWQMHAAIYRAVPGAGAVVHTHADACVALSCQRRSIPAFHYMVAGFGGDDVPCTGYAPFGSVELAELAAAALDGRSACLLANHGMIAHGPDLARAVAATRRLEILARQYLLALTAGPPVLLDSAQMAEVRRRYAGYGQQAVAR
ncbi:class II aldolase/adducin family protein [Thalassobaculum sp.]|uniref:class II aldolase/adducin family protein n=1 Tax=Thalassobaculum sp. TaxID=2022740 RepID=UPI0032EFDAE7